MLEQLLGVRSFGLDALLFFGEDFVVDEAFVGELDEVLLFGFERFESPPVDVGLCAGGLDAGGDELANHLPQAILLLCGVEDRPVVGRDCGFDSVDLEVAGSARP